MSATRQNDVPPLSLRVIAEWEKRIVQQKLLIADLTARGSSTSGAEIALKRYEVSLMQLRNHWTIMQALTTADPQMRDKPSRGWRY